MIPPQCHIHVMVSDVCQWLSSRYFPQAYVKQEVVLGLRLIIDFLFSVHLDVQ